ncbi:MAG TPA: rRNA maturation RNase YbeY [Moorella mulderi]|nr:rRNA maturation RNase YbeY [Moorella mulderi]
MKCLTSNQQDEVDIDQDLLDLLERALREAALLEKVETGAEVSLALVDEDTIRQLNCSYRGIDAPTDVLAFPLQEPGPGEPLDLPPEAQVLGDIIIAVPVAARQAGEYGHSLAQELVYLAVHGFLHLLGYDDATPEGARVMEEKQMEVLKRLGF